MKKLVRRLYQPSTLTYANPDDSRLRKFLIETLEVTTGRNKLERLYREIREMDIAPEQAWSLILGQLQVTIDYQPGQLNLVPRKGPVIFISNHPFGVVDGLILGELVNRVRPEFFVLVNEVLTREPLFARYLLPIDFRETREAMRTNIHTRRVAVQRLQAGEAMAIFPAGGVATARKPFGPAEDLEWKRFVAKLIRQAQATVVPLYFHGQNSRIFQIASQINPQLRLGLFLHEVRNKMGRTIRVDIGDPITWSQMAHLSDRQALLDFLREATHAVGQMR